MINYVIMLNYAEEESSKASTDMLHRSASIRRFLTSTATAMLVSMFTPFFRMKGLCALWKNST